MILVGLIDLVMLGVIVSVTLRRNLEAALPFFAFVLILLPLESQIRVSGLFVFTSARIAIMVFAALYFLGSKKGRDTQAIRRVPLKHVMLLTIAWGLLSTADSIIFTISLKTVLSQLLDYYLVYYLFFQAISEPQTVRRILMGIVAAMTVCCVFGFLEVYYGWSVIDLLPRLQVRLGVDAGLMIDLDRGLRVRSTFPHPILFGGALAIVIPVALYLLAEATSTSQKTFLWLAILMMLWNIYKTGSRGPWLGLVLACITLFFFSQARTRKHLLTIFLFAIAVFVIRPGVLETLENTYFETLNPDSPQGNSYAGRYDLIRLGTAALAKDFSRQVWGYGPESFGYLHFVTMGPEGHVVPAESCDNSWLELAVETGYTGMILVFAMFLTALRLVLRQFFRTAKQGRYLYGLVLSNVVTFAFLMISAAVYTWGQQSYLLWISIALGMAYPRLSTTPQEDQVKVTGFAFGEAAWEAPFEAVAPWSQYGF